MGRVDFSQPPFAGDFAGFARNGAARPAPLAHRRRPAHDAPVSRLNTGDPSLSEMETTEPEQRQKAEGQRAGSGAAHNVVALPHLRPPPPQVTFDRQELRALFDLYGRRVAAGEWRDYAIDFLRDMAVFSVFRRTSEMPLYRIVKNPALARKQGAYSVTTTGGQVLKRGHELARVLRVLDKRLSLVD
jgi:hypothetical protein